MGKRKIKFVTGFAGSGKSTELAARAKKDTLVLTPTHKAAEVLAKKGIAAYTINSVLKLVPTINKNFRKGQKIDSIKAVGEVDLEDINDIFIDEFSMINTSMLDMLLEVIPEHCEVTVFGDPYQLPPVTGKRIKPHKYSKDIHDLTIQHRSEAPEVVAAFMTFVEYIKGGCKGKPPKIKLPKGDFSTFTPETDRALGYTNNKVLSMNEEISKIVEPTNEVIVNGVECEIYEDPLGNFVFPKTMVRGKITFNESVSNKILEDMAKYGNNMRAYKKVSIKIGKMVYRCFVDFDHNTRLKKYKKEVEKYQNFVIRQNKLADDVDLTKWCRENRNGKFVMERGKAWSDYMTHKDLVFDVRSRFASTVHKSQGQEFDHIYLALKDLKTCTDKEIYARLCYVGLSRSKKGAIIV